MLWQWVRRARRQKQHVPGDGADGQSAEANGNGAAMPAANGSDVKRPRLRMSRPSSLAAIEAELKPKVETFDKIADNYKKLRRLQTQDPSFSLRHGRACPGHLRLWASAC